MLYRHTQIGYLLILIFGIVLLFILGRPWSLLGIALAGGCVALLPTLTFEIVDGFLVWYYGLGLIRKKAPLSEIETVAVVNSHWFRGWNLQRFSCSWLSTLSRFDAVEMKLKSGKVIRIGTYRAEELAAIITSARSCLIHDRRLTETFQPPSGKSEAEVT